MAKPDRICRYCGSRFKAENKDINRGKANYCSRSCVGHRPRPLGMSRSATRRRAREAYSRITGMDKIVCWCGLPADIHHDDGDPNNNSRENMIPLCRSHHVSLENHRFPKRKKQLATA